jgi:hypothetical protein
MPLPEASAACECSPLATVAAVDVRAAPRVKPFGVEPNGDSGVIRPHRNFHQMKMNVARVCERRLPAGSNQGD